MLLHRVIVSSRRGVRRFPAPDGLVELRGCLFRILVDVPGTFGIGRRGINRRFDDADRVTEGVNRLELHDQAAIAAVVADSLLVPREVMLLLRHAEVIGREHARWGALYLVVAAQRPRPAAARVEAERVPYLVLLELHVAQSAWADEMSAHRLEGQVEVDRQRLRPWELRNVELGIPGLEQGPDDRLPELAKCPLAVSAHHRVDEPVQMIDVSVLDAPPFFLVFGQL